MKIADMTVSIKETDLWFEFPSWIENLDFFFDKQQAEQLRDILVKHYPLYPPLEKEMD